MMSFLNILHFLLIFQPLIFALQLLVYKNANSNAARMLGTLMISVSFFYFTTAGFILEELNIVFLTSNIVYGLLLFMNPFFYLYTQALTVINFKFDRKALVHFIPAFVFLPLGIIASNTDLLKMETIRLVSTSLYNLQVVVYSILMIVLLVRHSSNIKYYFSFSEGVNLNWLKVFVGLYIVISSLDLLVFYVDNTVAWRLFYYILMVLFFNFLGFFGVYQPDIYGEDDKEIESEPIKDESVDKDELEKLTKASSGLTEERKESLMNEILEIMAKERPYLDSKLTIFELSRKLNINKTYISRVINDETHENFSAFINRYRIEEAKDYFQSDDYNNYTIEGVAHSVGFNSKASFNTYFKKFTGMTPSQYKQSLS